MIYLDSAATSLLKPDAVGKAMGEAVRRCASPGRGAHAAAMRAADLVLACREEAARLFHVPDAEQVVFTASATHGLNIAIRAVAAAGGRVVISGYEHNAVLRPLHALPVEIDVAASPLFDGAAVVEAFRRRIPGAAAVVCTHVSNVFGFILPVEEIAALCRAEGVPFVLDASQSAGVLDVDMEKLGCAYIAMPGHKGLFGPQGTGLLLCRETPEPLLYGGTGSLSAQREMPPFLPDRLEAGTHNVPGIAGLLEGLRYVQLLGPEAIRERERGQLALFAETLGGAENFRLFRAADEAQQAGVLSLVPSRMDCETLAEALAREDVAVRTGLHCAPLAHRTAGTDRTGTVRFSFSPRLRRGEVEAAAHVTKRILESGYNL